MTAKGRPSEWIFPKGHVEPNEDLVATALRELKEEAGIVDKLLGRVGSSEFRSGNEDVTATYFLIQALTGGEQREGRELAWLPYEATRDRLSFEDAYRPRL